MAKPLTIYIDASPLAETRITGIPHFTAELVRSLDRHPDNGKGFKVVLVIAFDKRKKLDCWSYTKVQIRTFPLPLRLLNLAWKYNVLPPMDLLLGKGTYLFPNYKNWRLIRSKSLTYIHDLGYIRYPEFVQPKNLEFLKNNMQRWIGRTDVVLTGADHARQEIITLLGVSPNKVVTIHHGVDHKDYYRRSLDEIARAKQTYGIAGEYLLYIGSIEPRKNLGRLIEAYHNLPVAIKRQYSLCLVGGGGWLNEQIHADIQAARQSGDTIVQPKIYVEDKDLPALMSGASLLVHPALYEGFGLSPLQSMACGTAVLVGNNSSLPEVVGAAGVLVDAGNADDISAKMELVLSDKTYREKLIEAGLNQAQNFTWEISAQQLLDNVYRLNKT
jgi:glycosyltransferase involved in cell wall biosynthesis